MKLFSRTRVAIALALSVLATGPVLAASSFQSGAGALSATAAVDFQITIPKLLYLRVGTGSNYPTTLANNATVDLVQFAPGAAVVGNGTAVAGTGGDQGAGVVTAAVIGNGGAVTLSASTTATGLTDGAGSFIPFTEILTASAAKTGGWTLLAAPTLVNGTSGSVTVPVNGTTKVVTADASWTYTYANTTVPSAGTYGGVNTNGSRATYTASLP